MQEVIAFAYDLTSDRLEHWSARAEERIKFMARNRCAFSG